MAAQFSGKQAPNSKRKQTGNVCAVVDCSGKNSDGISIHRFPKDPKQRQQWIDFVRTCRADFGPLFGTPNQNSFICERHFTSDAYPLKLRLSAEFGLPMVKLLNPGAVPTIQKHAHSHSSIRKVTVKESKNRRLSAAGLSTGVTTACGLATTTTVYSTPIPSALPGFSTLCGTYVKRKGRKKRCPLRYSTWEGIRMEWLDSDGWVAQPNSAISSITQTAVDRPHSCQRCSATFVLASSLRTHAAHIHGDGLQAFLAESGCHSCGDLTNHGDTTCDYIEPDKIKIEVCEEDSIQSNTLMSENQMRSNNVHGDNVTDSRSGIFDDTTCDIKPVKIKMEVCEEDSVHNNTLVSGTQTRSTSSHVHGKNVTDSHPGILDNPADDIQVDRIRIEMCQEDRERSSTLIPDSQTHVTDVHGKHVTGSLRKHECSHKNDRPYARTVRILRHVPTRPRVATTAR